MRKCITHCVEKTRIEIPIKVIGKSVLLIDILFVGGGALIGFMIQFPVMKPTSGYLIPISVGAGALAGYTMRRYSPFHLGWRRYIRNFLVFHIKSKLRNDGPRGTQVATYLSKHRLAPRLKRTPKRQLLKRSTVPVPPNYTFRNPS